jgi:hypothetical protein
MAVLLVSRDVEFGAEAEDADGVGAQLPGSVGVGEGGLVELLVGGVAFLVTGAAEVEAVELGGGVFHGPELPAHFELVGHVVVELLGSFGDGGFDGFVGGSGGEVDLGRRGGVESGVDVDALIGGRLGEVDGIGGGGGDAFAADQGELAEHSDERGGEALEAEVRVPEAEIEAICHEDSILVQKGTAEGAAKRENREKAEREGVPVDEAFAGGAT